MGPRMMAGGAWRTNRFGDCPFRLFRPLYRVSDGGLLPHILILRQIEHSMEPSTALATRIMQLTRRHKAGFMAIKLALWRRAKCP